MCTDLSPDRTVRCRSVNRLHASPDSDVQKSPQRKAGRAWAKRGQSNGRHGEDHRSMSSKAVERRLAWKHLSVGTLPRSAQLLPNAYPLSLTAGMYKTPMSLEFVASLPTCFSI